MDVKQRTNVDDDDDDHSDHHRRTGDVDQKSNQYVALSSI